METPTTPLLQPLYDSLSYFLPTTFFTNPFFMFLIDCIFFIIGFTIMYSMFFLPLKWIWNSLKPKRNDYL